MKKQDIDKLFKDKLIERQFPYKDSNWERAAAMLNAQNATAPFYKSFKFYGIATVVVLITTLSYIFLLPELKPIDQSEPKLENTITAPSKTKTPVDNYNESNTKTHSNQLEGINESVVDAPQKEITDSPEATKKNIQHSTMVNGSSSLPNISKIKSPLPKSNTSQTAIFNNSNDENTPTPASLDTNIFVTNSTNSNATVNELPNTDIVNGEAMQENSEKLVSMLTNTKENTGTIDSTKTNTIANSPQNDQIANTNSAEDIAEEPTIDKYEEETKAPSSIAQTNSYVPVDTISNPNSVNIPKYRPNSKVHFSLGWEVSAFQLQRKLETSDPLYIDYVNFRNNYESSSFNWNTGLMASIEYNNWLFSTGISYSQLNEDINYNPTYTALEVIDNSYWEKEYTQTTFVDSNWIIDGIFLGHWNYDTTHITTVDSMYISQVDSNYEKKVNDTISNNNGTHTLSYVEIPLLFGYHWDLKKWDIQLQTGASIGILSGTTGSTYIDYNLDYPLSHEEHKNQFTQLNYYFILRAGVGYKLGRNWMLGLYPDLRFGLNSVLKNEAINQRYNRFGLTLGVYYQF